MKLIDRDELLATLEQDIDVSVTGEENMEAVRKCMQEILDDVKESPVVDAVPVIRCRECRHRLAILVNGQPVVMLCGNERNDEAFSIDMDDYCSRAERKEE